MPGSARSWPSNASPNDGSRPLTHGWGVPLARPVDGVGRGQPVAGGSWPAGQPSPPSSPSNAPTVPVDRSEATMSKLTRALILGATLAAMNIAGLTTVAHSRANDPTTAKAVPALSWKDDYGTRHHVI